MAIYSGFSHEKWWFSIAMLVDQIVADVYQSVRDFWVQNYYQRKFAETSACFNVRKHNEHVGFLSNKSFKQTPWCGWIVATSRLCHHRINWFHVGESLAKQTDSSEKYATKNHYLSSKHHHPEKSFPHISSYIFHLKHYYWMNPLVNQTFFFLGSQAAARSCWLREASGRLVPVNSVT